MLLKPLRIGWNIGLLMFTVTSVILEWFIKEGLGFGENILGGIMLHVNCLVFILLAFILKPIKIKYIFLAFVLLANEISASFWGMSVLGYNALLRIHSVIGFAMMVMVVLGVNWTSSIKKSDCDSMFFLIFFGGIFSCLYAMIVQFSILRQYFVGADAGWYYTSFLGHRNQFGGFLYISTIAALYLWQRSRNIVYPIFAAIFFQNIVVTDSRNAFFSAILFFSLYFVFIKKISLRTMIILGIPILFIVLLVGMNLNDITLMFAHKNGRGLEEEERFVMWSLLLAEIYEHGAWLSGFGFGSQALFLSRFHVSSAHNTFVSLLFDGGIIKLILYIILLVIIFIRICRHNNDSYRDLMKAGFLSFIFYNLFDNASLLFSSNSLVSITATIIFAVLPQYKKES